MLLVWSLAFRRFLLQDSSIRKEVRPRRSRRQGGGTPSRPLSVPTSTPASARQVRFLMLDLLVTTMTHARVALRTPAGADVGPPTYNGKRCALHSFGDSLNPGDR